MSAFIDLMGQQFGRLSVLKRKEGTAHGVTWDCKCECGNSTTAQGSDLRRGFKKSCGCLQRETNAKTAKLRTVHGHKSGGKETRTYRSWRGMFGRCSNPRHPAFRYYGAVGIKVCERWGTFVNFLEDMGDRPERTTLDRINGAGDYEPDNCRWASWRIQNHNRLFRNGKSKFRGVSPSGKKWQAHISASEYNQIYLGVFTDEVSAARAYDAAAMQYFGHQATTNFSRSAQR